MMAHAHRAGTLPSPAESRVQLGPALARHLTSIPQPSQRRCTASRARRRTMVTCAAKRLIALDFDGVICDSVGESSLSAFKAAAIQWPEIFTSPAAIARKDELVEKMRAVRPVVETGYENIVQIRALYDGMSVDEMLGDWERLLPQLMNTLGLERQAMVKLFGDVRDQWIASDLDGWLAPNRIYTGVAEPVAQAVAKDEVYIVTTKQAHYTEILMRDMAKVPFAPDRIFSQTVSGRPKTEVLSKLADQHPEAQPRIFVEDKLATLEKVCKAPGFEDWQLYLVDWGYNTPKERQRAQANDRIQVIDLNQFQELMKGQ